MLSSLQAINSVNGLASFQRKEAYRIKNKFGVQQPQNYFNALDGTEVIKLPGTKTFLIPSTRQEHTEDDNQSEQGTHKPM